MAAFSQVVAPTGAGKSYVYNRAMAQEERILFVVPTRRLAQNLAASTVSDLMSDPLRLPEAQAARRVQVFTSDEARRMRAAGIGNVTAVRLSRLAGFQFSGGGDITFATPEAISWLLLHVTNRHGLGDVGPATLMTEFDRIVFDEAHLMQPRGFGLMAVLAKLAQDGPWEGIGRASRARVSALSATPVDVSEVMARLGVRMDAASTIRETLTQGSGRALHGDVTLEFVDAESPLEATDALRSEIAALPESATCAVIYDSLRFLKRDEPNLEALAKALGLWDGPNGYFIDSSLDAQKESDHSGRSKDISRRRLLVATSTIEVGVNLPGLTLLIMDPGFSPLSLMQRIGRVARGDRPGRVVVCAPERILQARPWLRSLIGAIRSSGVSISIDCFVGLAAAEARVAQRFAPVEDGGGESVATDALGRIAADPALYGAMSTRAIYAAGVYWNLLMDALQCSGGSGHLKQAKKIQASMPPVGRTVRSWMDAVIGSRLEGSKKWIATYRAEAAVLRDFTPTVIVVDGTGARQEVSAAWLAKHTHVLQNCPVIGTENGKAVIHVADLEWAGVIRRDGDFGRYERFALLPFQCIPTPVGRAPVEEFRQRARSQSMQVQSSRQRDAIEAAVRLVCCTGVVPYDDSIENLGADTLVL